MSTATDTGIRLGLWTRLDVRYKAMKFREALIMQFVWAMPRVFIRWAVVRAVAHASTGKWGMEHPGRLKAFEVMDRWELPQ